MNVDLMGEYIEFVADRLLQMLGLDVEFGATNPVRVLLFILPMIARWLTSRPVPVHGAHLHAREDEFLRAQGLRLQISDCEH